MAKKRSRSGTKESGTNTALLVGGGLLGLYLITRPGAAQDSTTIIPTKETIYDTTKETIYKEGGPSILKTWTTEITKTIAGTAVGIAEVPGGIVFGLPEAIVKASEESTSQQVFGGAPRTGVSAFMATESPGSTFKKAVTYPEFMAQQPPVFRAAATAGNILTGNVAAGWGAYTAEETKKGQKAAGMPEGQFEERFAALPTQTRGPIAPWGGQALVGLGQFLTVPLGGGGAAGWGASIAGWMQQSERTKKEAALNI